LTNRARTLLVTDGKPTRRLTIRFISQLITAMREQGCPRLGKLVVRSRSKSRLGDRLVIKAWWRVPLYRRLLFVIAVETLANPLLGHPSHGAARPRAQPAAVPAGLEKDLS
jgi:hypothetical protein